MEEINQALPSGKKLYFASDFHLGAPSSEESRERERKVIAWLSSIRSDAQAIFLVGDIFDFWFEYKHVIPKGFVRFQGQIAAIRDAGIPVHFFHGNHDMWMRSYFTVELGIQLHADQVRLTANDKILLVGHGDGLGPGDRTYKVIKRVFRNRMANWAFQWLHPNVGMFLAQRWSSSSRKKNLENSGNFVENDEMLLQYCREQERQQHHDYYIFGHRHLPLEMPVGSGSRYINLGEWVNDATYAEFDGQSVQLKKFDYRA